ncbi:unnamed protein product [Tetraodon nigroviridis]|uniref:(spotted green pufferfish) hypothetical protein n=1 Tax=Tetraodon nigroviridis TaxID=99883 RepID=Q4ST21_TETNG|nr:unnamed protein product [Tetraodon nigroviridis]
MRGAAAVEGAAVVAAVGAHTRAGEFSSNPACPYCSRSFLLLLHDVEYCAAPTHEGPASTLGADPRLLEDRPVHHTRCSNRHRCGPPARLSTRALHPRLPDRVGGLRPGPGRALLPALRPPGQRRAGQPAQPGLHRLEFAHHLLPVLLVYRRKRLDLLHLRAQLQQERHQRGAVLQQDPVPVRVLDHHPGLHPGGPLPPGQLLHPRLFLPAGPSRSRRQRLGVKHLHLWLYAGCNPSLHTNHDALYHTLELLIRSLFLCDLCH